MTREEKQKAIDALKISAPVMAGLTQEKFNDYIQTLNKVMDWLEQEPCRDMEEIAEVMNCDADAETKCKMISDILTAKPHYFKMQEPKESEEKYDKRRAN